MAEFRDVWDHGVLCVGGIFVPPDNHTQVDMGDITNQKCLDKSSLSLTQHFSVVRLYSDHDFLVTSARRLGLEAGQGLLEGDIVDNLSSGLETARGAYNFLADLS